MKDLPNINKLEVTATPVREMSPREQILKRFSEEMQADFYTDPILYQVVKYLEAGADPYLLIGDILQAYKKLSDEHTELLLKMPYGQDYEDKQREADEIVNDIEP